MNAILVSVDYDDFLAITLPGNHAHFEKIVVVTDQRDERTAAVAARFPNVVVHRTDAFYARGAPFNKGAGVKDDRAVLTSAVSQYIVRAARAEIEAIPVAAGLGQTTD